MAGRTCCCQISWVSEVRGGVEPIARWIELAEEGLFATRTSITHVAALDFRNDYNTADAICPNSRSPYTVTRSAYGGVSDLLLRGPDGSISRLLSAQGVRQGDPIGPLLFSTTMRPLLADLEVWLGSPHYTVSFLDDVHIKGPSADIVPRVQEFLANRQSSLQLNVSKCRTASLDTIAEEGCATNSKLPLVISRTIRKYGYRVETECTFEMTS